MTRLLIALAVVSLCLGMLPAAGEDTITVTEAAPTLVRGDLGPALGDPLATAAAALDRVDQLLRVEASAFRFESVRTSLVGTHVRGRQYRDGLPVDHTAVAVHVVGDRVWQVDAVASAATGNALPGALPRHAAQAAALRAVAVKAPLYPPVAERLLVPHAGRLVDTWRVAVFAHTPPVSADVDIAAADGSVLRVRDTRAFVDGTASVFNPNPVVTARNKELRQPGELMLPADADLDADELSAQLRILPLRDLDPKGLLQGRLSGPWVDVVGSGPLFDANPRFTRGDPRFEATMSYAHLDGVQRYFQTLGFVGEAGVNAEPQDVVATRVEGFDNSFYHLAYDFILFGTGGVDDGEDAEVILHEYGHAIHHDQVPGWGRRHEGGAMGEGFGDFLAAAYYAREQSGGFQDVCVADWDATSYSSQDPPCLRRVDSTKVYPKDMRGRVHADGEIWSAFLWRLRDLLVDEEDPRPDPVEKSDNVLTLVLASHEFLTPEAEFAHAVAALRIACEALGHPEWVPLVEQAAKVSKLPLLPQ